MKGRKENIHKLLYDIREIQKSTSDFLRVGEDLPIDKEYKLGVELLVTDVIDFRSS